MSEEKTIITEEPSANADNENIENVREENSDKKKNPLKALKTAGKCVGRAVGKTAKTVGKLTAATLSIAGDTVSKLGDSLGNALSDKDDDEKKN